MKELNVGVLLALLYNCSSVAILVKLYFKLNFLLVNHVEKYNTGWSVRADYNP